MGAGNHLDFGRSPSPVCAYLRDLAAGATPRSIWTPGGVQAATHGDYNTVMKYRTSKPNEYFLVENRSKMGLDRALPASGLAVYHCDIFGSNELQQGTATRHYQCALLQADGQPRPRDERQPGRRHRPVRRDSAGSRCRPNRQPHVARVGRPRLGTGDLEHLGSRSGDHVHRRAGGAGADRAGPGRAEPDHPGQQHDRHHQHHPHRRVRNRAAHQGRRGHQAHLHRRPASRAHRAVRAVGGPARAAWRIERRPRRHLRFGPARRVGGPGGPADAGRTGCCGFPTGRRADVGKLRKWSLEIESASA